MESWRKEFIITWGEGEKDSCAFLGLSDVKAGVIWGSVETLLPSSCVPLPPCNFFLEANRQNLGSLVWARFMLGRLIHLWMGWFQWGGLEWVNGISTSSSFWGRSRSNVGQILSVQQCGFDGFIRATSFVSRKNCAGSWETVESKSDTGPAFTELMMWQGSQLNNRL